MSILSICISFLVSVQMFFTFFKKKLLPEFYIICLESKYSKHLDVLWRADLVVQNGRIVDMNRMNDRNRGELKVQRDLAISRSGPEG